MYSTKKASRLGYRIEALIAFTLVAGTFTGRSQYLQYFVPESVGARGGNSFTGGQGGEFWQTEAFADWNLPLKTESNSGWYLQTKLNLSVGWLGGTGINAAEGTLAPAVAFGRRHFPLWLEGGIGPTFISQYDFGLVNFGEQLQFTSFVGVNFDLTPHWRLGYRFQHMSNAGFAKSNPGLNLNMFALSYAF
jgi:hypothetical protein